MHKVWTLQLRDWPIGKVLEEAAKLSTEWLEKMQEAESEMKITSIDLWRRDTDVAPDAGWVYGVTYWIPNKD